MQGSSSPLQSELKKRVGLRQSRTSVVVGPLLTIPVLFPPCVELQLDVHHDVSRYLELPVGDTDAPPFSVFMARRQLLATHYRRVDDWRLDTCSCVVVVFAFNVQRLQECDSWRLHRPPSPGLSDSIVDQRQQLPTSTF